MDQHIFLALSKPRTGREEEFHGWYDQHHLHDVVDFSPGFVRGRRYWAIDPQPVGSVPRWPSLAIYDLESDDLVGLHAGVSANVKHFTPSNGVFEDDHSAWVYSPIAAPTTSGDWTPVVHADAATGRRLILAFSQELPAADDVSGLDGILRSQHWERGSGQRPGVDVPWRYLTTIDTAADRAVELARGYATAMKPGALWVYEPRGTEVTTQAR